MGVGLGLAGYQPDELDLKQVQTAVRVSEELEIEQTMFEDKLKTTDWEATNEAIEEQIARESYLQWCRENMQRTKKSVSATVTSQSPSSSMSMPGSSSGGSSSLLGSVGGSAASSVTMSSSGIGGGVGLGGVECNNMNMNKMNNSPSPTMISLTKAGATMLEQNATPTSAIAGRMSPKQHQQYQSDDGLKSGGSGSSTCTSTASSSSSSGSSSLLGDNNSSNGNNTFEGSLRQRRRRRRHNNNNNHSVHNNSVCAEERGSELPKASPPELAGLNLVETRSTTTTDSNDSDCSDATMSKRMKRRLEGEVEVELGLGVNMGEMEQPQKEISVEEEMKGYRHSGSSVELTEPGPSKSGPEAIEAASAGVKQPDNFYHSLLESSYIDDGEL